MERYRIDPADVLEAWPFGRFLALFRPSKVSRSTDADRLRELRNQQRLRAGKAPILPKR